ncbi:MAG: DUF3047 domain-containing protein [Pseudomonadota bacterium]
MASNAPPFGKNMIRIFIASIALLLTGCMATPRERPSDPATSQVVSDNPIAAFSTSPAGTIPIQWTPIVIHRNKKKTKYQLVAEHDRAILHARAVGASSGLMQHVSIDPLAQPMLNWQWRIGNIIPSADNYQRDAEDSPVRIVLGFDGDKDSLPFADQILFDTVKLLTGQEIPYATLMYVWENKAPVGTIIPSTRSGRIKMMVAGSGSEGIGQWHEFTRNIVADYEKAFGEKPGKLIGVGVLTDTDNTGETVDAWYGDIRSFREREVVVADK